MTKQPRIINSDGRILPRQRFYHSRAEVVGLLLLLLTIGLLISTGRCFCVL
jgi:hypothetical protein